MTHELGDPVLITRSTRSGMRLASRMSPPFLQLLRQLTDPFAQQIMLAVTVYPGHPQRVPESLNLCGLESIERYALLRLDVHTKTRI